MLMNIGNGNGWKDFNERKGKYSTTIARTYAQQAHVYPQKQKSCIRGYTHTQPHGSRTSSPHMTIAFALPGRHPTKRESCGKQGNFRTLTNVPIQGKCSLRGSRLSKSRPPGRVWSQPCWRVEPIMSSLISDGPPASLTISFENTFSSLHKQNPKKSVSTCLPLGQGDGKRKSRQIVLTFLQGMPLCPNTSKRYSDISIPIRCPSYSRTCWHMRCRWSSRGE